MSYWRIEFRCSFEGGGTAQIWTGGLFCETKPLTLLFSLTPSAGAAARFEQCKIPFG